MALADVRVENGGTALPVSAMARSSEHSLVYPKDGTRLGPAAVRPAC